MYLDPSTMFIKLWQDYVKPKLRTNVPLGDAVKGLNTPPVSLHDVASMVRGSCVSFVLPFSPRRNVTQEYKLIKLSPSAGIELGGTDDWASR